MTPDEKTLFLALTPIQLMALSVLGNPPSIPLDLFYGTFRNPIILRNNSVFSCVLSYLSGLSIGQFGPRVFFASTVAASSLLHSVMNVIKIFSQKQMMFIAARWGIAMVKNIKAFGNWPNMHLIGYSVGGLNMFISRVIHAKGTISLAVLCARPQETAAHWFCNEFFFKSFLAWTRVSGILISRHSGLLSGSMFRAWEKVTLLLCPFLILPQRGYIVTI